MKRTYLGEFDIVALIDTQINPVKDQLVWEHVSSRILNDQDTQVVLFLQLLLPSLTEDHCSVAGERGIEENQWLTLVNALPNRDELLLAIGSVFIQSAINKRIKRKGMVSLVASSCDGFTTRSDGVFRGLFVSRVWIVLLLDILLANSSRFLFLVNLTNLVDDILADLLSARRDITGAVTPGVVIGVPISHGDS